MVLIPSCGHLIRSQLDDFPGGYKVLGADGDEIDSFPEGGEVDPVQAACRVSAINNLTVYRGDCY